MNTFNTNRPAYIPKTLQQQLAEQLKDLEDKEEKEEKKDKKYQEQPYLKDPLPGNNLSTSAASFVWPDKLDPDQRILLGMGMREAREKAGYTQKALGKLANLEDQEICRWEGGKIAKVNKPVLKRIGNILRDDFNELMMAVCTDSKKPIYRPAKQTLIPVAPGVVRVSSGLSAIAETPTLHSSEEQKYKLKGPDFELHATIDEEIFKFSIIQKDGALYQIYKGSKDKNNLFLQALEEMIKKVRKGM